MEVAAGWGGDCSCDGASETVAACANGSFGLRSAAAIRTPQRRRSAVGRSFKFVFNSNVTMTVDTQLQEMWLSAL